MTLNMGLFLWIGRDEGECANVFAVKTHVLREGLRQGDLVTLLNEVADREGVLGSVSGCETLVRHVEEGEKLLLLDEIRNFLPSSRSWINAGRVVGICV